MIRRYAALSKTKPRVFNAVNAMTLTFISDTIQQRVDFNKTFLNRESKNKDAAKSGGQNWYQTFTMGLFSLTVSQLLTPYYVKILPKLAPLTKNPTFLQTARKVATDHLLLCPV